MLLTLSLIVNLLFLFPSPSLCIPRVATPQGTYVGSASVPGVDQFLSIRYAEPPVGQLRFADPVPYHSGTEGSEVDVSSYGPGCQQDPTLQDGNRLSEDCLTLEVIRPANIASTKPLPVMVFIFGGANFNGQIKWYNGTGLVQTASAAGKPVIYVSMNYRLGGFGFLYNSVFQRQGNLLNAGLKDQHLALQWVKANIARFGGDPSRVTLFGQSAGSFNAWMQMRYAAAHNETGNNALFQSAILESGAPASLALKGQTPSNGDAYLNQTLVEVGCAPLLPLPLPLPLIGGPAPSDAEALRCLRNVSSAKLSSYFFNPASPGANKLDDYVQEQIGFAVDGVWIDAPYYWADEVVPIPLITGTTLNEGSLYGKVPTNTAMVPPSYLRDVIAKNLNTTNNAVAQSVLDTYKTHTNTQNGKGYHADPTLDPTLLDLSLDLKYYLSEAVLGDAVQDHPRRVLLGQHSSSANAVGGSGAPTWGYMFKQRPPQSIYSQHFYNLPRPVPQFTLAVLLSRIGVAHASELAYVFGTILGLGGRTDGDVEVSRKMQAMWFSFAYNKDPNSHGLPNIPTWEQYDPQNARIYQFQEQGGAVSGMTPDNMRLDSYNAYRSAVAQLGLPPLPEIKATA